MKFFMEYFLIYLVIINLFAFVLWGIDKRKAVKGKWRISEKKLLLTSLFGGFVGAFLGMNVWRHKTIKGKFLIWFYGICFLWLAGIVGVFFFL